MDRMAPGLDRYHSPESSARGPIVRAQTSVLGELVGLRGFLFDSVFSRASYILFGQIG